MSGEGHSPPPGLLSGCLRRAGHLWALWGLLLGENGLEVVECEHTGSRGTWRPAGLLGSQTYGWSLGDFLSMLGGRWEPPP